MEALEDAEAQEKHEREAASVVITIILRLRQEMANRDVQTNPQAELEERRRRAEGGGMIEDLGD